MSNNNDPEIKTFLTNNLRDGFEKFENALDKVVDTDKVKSKIGKFERMISDNSDNNLSDFIESLNEQFFVFNDN